MTTLLGIEVQIPGVPVTSHIHVPCSPLFDPGGPFLVWLAPLLPGFCCRECVLKATNLGFAGVFVAPVHYLRARPQAIRPLIDFLSHRLVRADS
eukprot:1105210-Rhodomonas_salina.4